MSFPFVLWVRMRPATCIVGGHKLRLYLHNGFLEGALSFIDEHGRIEDYRKVMWGHESQIVEGFQTSPIVYVDRSGGSRQRIGPLFFNQLLCQLRAPSGQVL